MATALLTYPEAAERIHVSVSTARRLGRAGRLDEIRVSRGAVRVREDSVERLIQFGYDTGPSQAATS
jgi:excisionase family DNA binding protein